MSLLAHAVALVPHAHPDALAVVGAHLAGSPDDGALTVLLTHPATPDHVSGTCDPYVDTMYLDLALRSPLATPATRQRTLAAYLTDPLTGYVATPWSHPAAVTHLANRVEGLPHPYDDASAVLGHPAASADDRVRALRVLLALPVDALPATHLDPDDVWLLTHATRLPEHLPALASIAEAAGRRTLALALTGYAADSRAGRDVHAARLAAARDRPRTEGQWADAVTSTADADIAALALEHEPHSWRVIDAILTTPALAYTDPAHRAAARRFGDPQPLPPARPGATYTEAERRTAMLRESLDSMTVPVDPDDGELLERAVRAVTTAFTDAAYQTAPGHVLARHAARLSLHPRLSDADRTQLTAITDAYLRTEPPNPRRMYDLPAPIATVHHLATATDRTRQALATPVRDLATAARHDTAQEPYLAALCATALTDVARDARQVTSVLALADQFPGTLAELLTTSAVVAA